MREKLVAGELDGYQPEVGAALWRLEDARDRALRLLSNLPAGYVDQETDGNSIGTILYHLADIEADWLYAEILEEPFPPEIKALFPADTRDEEGVLTAIKGQTLQEHLARLRAVRANLLEKLRPMTREDFYRPRSLPNYDVSPAWVLHHLAQHDAEHRGELGAIIASLSSGN